MNEMEFKNRRVFRCCLLVLVIMSLGFFMGFINGKYSIGYFALALLVFYLPLILNFMYLRKKPDGMHSKSILAVGFALVYIFYMANADSPVAFAFAFPLLAVITIYGDPVFCAKAGTGIIIIVCAFVGIHFNQGMNSQIDMANYQIQITSLILLVIYTVVAAKTIARANKEQLDKISQEQSKQQAIMENIINATKTIGEEVGHVYNESQAMEVQTNQVQSAIDEITIGTNDVTNNVQIQLEMSQNINSLTEAANQLVKEIQGKFLETKEFSNIGSENMNVLAEAASKSNDACLEVGDAMKELTGKTEEVKSILVMISEIASQTSLLSLNASIESARAGEAGRGFAVVANEIKTLAEETQNATEKINKIFEELTNYNNKALSVVDDLKEYNDHQVEVVGKTKENFEKIKGDIDQVTQAIETQTDHMEKIKESNREIGNSIETVSAATEELLASSESTQGITIETLASASKVTQAIDLVKQEIERLEHLE